MRRWIVFAIAVVAVVAGVVASGQVDRPGPTYQLWEYHTESARGPGNQEMPESALNTLGRQGWELTALTRREIRVQDSMQTETVYVFKRSRADARR